MISQAASHLELKSWTNNTYSLRWAWAKHLRFKKNDCPPHSVIPSYSAFTSALHFFHIEYIYIYSPMTLSSVTNIHALFLSIVTRHLLCFIQKHSNANIDVKQQFFFCLNSRLEAEQKSWPSTRRTFRTPYGIRLCFRAQLEHADCWTLMSRHWRETPKQ